MLNKFCEVVPATGPQKISSNEKINVRMFDLFAFTWAVESVSKVSFNTGTGVVPRCVGAVSVWTAASVIHSTLINICGTTHLGLRSRILLNRIG